MLSSAPYGLPVVSGIQFLTIFATTVNSVVFRESGHAAGGAFG